MSSRSFRRRVLRFESFRRKCGGAMAVMYGNFEERVANSWLLRER
jgi:hypothetical protein